MKQEVQILACTRLSLHNSRGYEKTLLLLSQHHVIIYRNHITALSDIISTSRTNICVIRSNRQNKNTKKLSENDKIPSQLFVAICNRLALKRASDKSIYEFDFKLSLEYRFKMPCT